MYDYRVDLTVGQDGVHRRAGSPRGQRCSVTDVRWRGPLVESLMIALPKADRVVRLSYRGYRGAARELLLMAGHFALGAVAITGGRRVAAQGMLVTHGVAVQVAPPQPYQPRSWATVAASVGFAAFKSRREISAFLAEEGYYTEAGKIVVEGPLMAADLIPLAQIIDDIDI